MDYYERRRSSSIDYFSLPFSFHRRPTGVSTASEVSPLENTNYVSVHSPPSYTDPPPAYTAVVRESITSVESRMSGESVRYFDEEMYERPRTSSNGNWNSLSKP